MAAFVQEVKYYKSNGKHSSHNMQKYTTQLSHMRQRVPMLRPLHPKCASVKQSQRDTSYPSLQAAEWGMESEQHAGRGLSAPRYLVPGKNPSCPEVWAWALPQKDQTLRQTHISGQRFIVVVEIIIQVSFK